MSMMASAFFARIGFPKSLNIRQLPFSTALHTLPPLLALAILLPASSQPASAEDPQPKELTQSSTKRLTYEEYATFAEQAITSLSAQLANLRNQNTMLQAQLKGIQDTLLTKAGEDAEQQGKKFVETEKSLLDKYAGCTSIKVTGELNCSE